LAGCPEDAQLWQVIGYTTETSFYPNLGQISSILFGQWVGFAVALWFMQYNLWRPPGPPGDSLRLEAELSEQV